MNIKHPSIVGIALLAAVCLRTHAIAAPPEPLAQSPVGLEGRVYYRSEDSNLQTAPVDDKSEVTLRIADRIREQGGSLRGMYLYDLRYIAAVPGDFDLRANLRHADSSPITDGESLLVRASSSLPANANADLIPIATGAHTRMGGYRLGLIALGALWLLPLAWLVIKRMRRSKTLIAQAAPGPPTLADQIRPLVESAMTGSLADPERARLERLLIAHWRDRLHLLARSHADTIHILRLHKDAGPLLSHLESWLHKPASSNAASAPDLHALLAPYRNAAPIADLNGHTPAPASSSTRARQEVTA